MTDADEVASDIGLKHVIHLLGHDLQAQRLQSAMWRLGVDFFRCLAIRDDRVTTVQRPLMAR
jgi:hypothetical protein